MKYTFKRHDEISLRDFVRQTQQQYAALDALLKDTIPTEEVLAYVEGILATGRPCRNMPDALFWGYDEPETMPGDCRVPYYYMPTYLNTAFLMQAYRRMPVQIGERIPYFIDRLQRAMVACSGRGFMGHRYEKDDFAEGLLIFSSVRTKDFIRTHGDVVPEVFARAYYAAIRSVERDVYDVPRYLRRIENSWESNNLDAYRTILARENQGRRTLFVYGSLMKRGYNHDRFMSDAHYIGDALIAGFELYDLGPFPGIKHAAVQEEEPVARGRRRRRKSLPPMVRGELYDVSEKAYADICELESNGTLYQSETVRASLGLTESGGGDWTPAEVFVYLGSVEG